MIYLNTDRDPLNQVKIPIQSDGYVGGIPTFIKKNPNNYMKMLSSAHKIIYQSHHNPNIDEVFFAKINQSYIDELVLLHREWFPTFYDKEHFKKYFVKKGSILIGAFVKLYGNNYLIGCCIGEIVNEDKFRENVVNVLYERGFFNSFFSKKGECFYIHSFGIIDEYRKKGICTNLFNKVIAEMKVRKCIGIYMHVIEYNKSAISFLEKNKWMNAGIRKHYYCLDGKFFDAKTFYYILQTEMITTKTMKQIDPTIYAVENNPQNIYKKGCFQSIFGKIKKCCCCGSSNASKPKIRQYNSLVNNINEFEK